MSRDVLQDLSFEDVSQLLAVVEGVLEGIEKVTLQAIFLEWIKEMYRSQWGVSGVSSNKRHRG
jgi:hypothetical protein